MSSHSRQAHGRHPAPGSFTRESYPLAHVLIELIDHPENGITFGLRTKYGPDNRPCLCSGHIERGMATELRRLAHRLDELEAKLSPEDG